MTMDDLLREAGRITVEWARLESGLRFVLTGLVGGEEPTALWLTADMNADELLRRIQTIAPSALADEDASALQEVCRTIDLLRRQRNDLVHCAWLADPNNDVVQLLKMSAGKGRRPLSVDSETRSLSDLRELGDRVKQAANEVGAFLYRLSGSGGTRWAWYRLLAGKGNWIRDS